MKFAGLLVMPAGLLLSLAAILLFPDPTRRAAFILCGIAVEAMGIVVSVRGHMIANRGSQGHALGSPSNGDFRP